MLKDRIGCFYYITINNNIYVKWNIIGNNNNNNGKLRIWTIKSVKHLHAPDCNCICKGRNEIQVEVEDEIQDEIQVEVEDDETIFIICTDNCMSK